MDNGGRRAHQRHPDQNLNPDWIMWTSQDIKRFFEKRRAQKAKESPSDTAARRTANATWAIAFLTLVMIVVGVSQFLIFERQLEEMKSGGADTHALAEAARTQAEIARLDQRAWIGIQSITPTPQKPSVGQEFVASVEFKNTGKTPALNIKLISVGQAIDRGNEINFSYDAYHKLRTGILFPGGTTYAFVSPVANREGTSIAVTESIMKAIEQKDLMLVVHGQVEYDDVFGRPHWIVFCSKLTAPFNGRFELCDRHNESDDGQKQ